MAPPAADVDVQPVHPIADVSIGAKTPSQSSASRLPEPLRYSGSLDAYEQVDLTAAIGREFPNLQLSELLQDDTKVRDLAILGTPPSRTET